MYSAIYWITRLDYIQGFCIGFLTLCGFIALAVTIWLSLEGEYVDDEKVKSAKSWRTRSMIFGFVFSLFVMFLPSKDDAILIYAGGKAYEYVKSDTALQKIPYATTEYLKTLLEKEIKEVKESK